MTHFRTVLEYEDGGRQIIPAGESRRDGEGTFAQWLLHPAVVGERVWAVSFERSAHGNHHDHRWDVVEQERLPDLAPPDDDPDSMIDGRWGWCSPVQQQLLEEFATSAPAGVVVELGAWKGLSARALRRAGKTVVSVDPFRLPNRPAHALDAREHFDRLNGTDAGIRPIAKLAHLATDDVTEPVALLYLDADHSYEGTHRDLAAWAPKLAEGALVIFDDVTRVAFPGIVRLMADLEDDGTLAFVDEQEGQVAWRLPPGRQLRPRPRRRFLRS